MTEVWKQFRETPYWVSNLGRVKRVYKSKERFLTPALTDEKKKLRYFRVSISQNNKKKCFSVHRLVAEVFLGSPKPPAVFVNHIDFNPQNNRVDNLEWVTPDGNIQHSKVAGRLARGEKHGLSGVTEETAKELKRLYVPGVNQFNPGNSVALSERFGLGIRHVRQIVAKVGWKHLEEPK